MFKLMYNTADSNGGGAAPPAAGAATPPPANDAGAPQPWTAKLSPELKGYAESKGWQSETDAILSYQNAEKYVGHPIDLTLKLPKEADSKDWGEVYKKLGKPEKPDGYTAKVSEKLGRDEAFETWARETFHKHNLTKAQGEALFNEWNALQEGAFEKMTAEQTTAAKNDFDALKQKWGNAYDQNQNIATAAAKQFGVEAKDLDAIQKVLGYSRTMELMHKIGSGMGEANFQNGSKTATTAMSPEQAAFEIKQLIADSEFRKKLQAGDFSARQRWDKLHADLAPNQAS